MSKEIILQWVMAHKKLVVGTWLALVAAGVGVLVWQGGVFDQPKIEIKRVNEPPKEASVAGVIKKIWVDVSGEAVKPGVYSFELGARVIEAINFAGGFSKNADMDCHGRLPCVSHFKGSL